MPNCRHNYRGGTILTFTCCKILGIQNTRFLQGSDAGVHQLQASGELFFYVLLSVYGERHRTREGNYIGSGLGSGHQRNAKADKKKKNPKKQNPSTLSHAILLLIYRTATEGGKPAKTCHRWIYARNLGPNIHRGKKIKAIPPPHFRVYATN